MLTLPIPTPALSVAIKPATVKPVFTAVPVGLATVTAKDWPAPAVVEVAYVNVPVDVPVNVKPVPVATLLTPIVPTVVALIALKLVMFAKD